MQFSNSVPCLPFIESAFELRHRGPTVFHTVLHHTAVGLNAFVIPSENDFLEKAILLSIYTQNLAHFYKNTPYSLD